MSYYGQGATQAFAVPGEDSLIDVVHPVTGLSEVEGETLEQVQARYPGAEVIEIAGWLAAKAERQHTPITWTECPEDYYMTMLGVLPPADMWSGGFLVGEPTDHDAGDGRPRFAAFRQWGSRYYEANRPLTIPEFRAEIARRTE